jgi:fructose-1,6-bisphosphatase/inositol monophosphatase family enzyme
MNIKKNIATSENGFIFNPATGDSFSANKLAALILTEMKAGTADEEIKEDILSRYEVTPEQLNRDWDDYLLQLRDANLLET